MVSGSVDQRSEIGAWYPAMILAGHSNGTFDVKYDGGGRERGVERARVQLETMPEWELVYKGKDLGYAVEASVPDVVLEREEGITVNMQFVLQTLGTEFPIDEPSLHSEQAVFSTVNRDKVVASFMDQMRAKESGSKTKKKIMEAIEIDGGLINSWHAGKLVEGTGTGQHFV